MSQTSLHPMLNIAIKAARAAGAIINRGSQDLDLLTVSHKGPNDFVSEVDRAAEAAIIDTLLTAYPNHGILAEESGRERGSRHSEYLWIIDPLDGTTNFLHGFPVYCVSIALAFRGKVEQAVVYDPTRNDLFYASRGRGAFLNDRRLRVSRRTRLAECLIGTGFPFRRGDQFQRYLKILEQVMPLCAGIRRPGAAALDLCYVAAGWTDGFFESGLNPWDMAAGSLIVTEAGGLIGNFTGEADYLYQREVIAASPKIYGQLVSLLAPHSRAIRPDESDGEEAGSGPAAAATPLSALGESLRADAQPESEPAPATTAPVRERKPVRIRRAEQPAEAAEAPASTEPTLSNDPDDPFNPIDPIDPPAAEQGPMPGASAGSPNAAPVDGPGEPLASGEPGPGAAEALIGGSDSSESSGGADPAAPPARAPVRIERRRAPDPDAADAADRPKPARPRADRAPADRPRAGQPAGAGARGPGAGGGRPGGSGKAGGGGKPGAAGKPGPRPDGRPASRSDVRGGPRGDGSGRPEPRGPKREPDGGRGAPPRGGPGRGVPRGASGSGSGGATGGGSGRGPGGGGPRGPGRPGGGGGRSGGGRGSGSGGGSGGGTGGGGRGGPGGGRGGPRGGRG